MWSYYYPFIPMIPNTNQKPPTIYAILNSYVNGEKDDFLSDDYISPSKVAEYGRYSIFDFDYPLSSKIDKKDFEVMILNKFMMRRIGYETLTAFKIALNVKLNEIMPKYNKLFDSFIDWNIFIDGEVTNRTLNEKRNDSANSSTDATSNTNNVSDRRYSNVPQNQIYDIKNGSYMTDYNLDTDENSIETSTNADTSSNGNTDVLETIQRSPSDKFALYKEMLEMQTNIYTMIFKDLSVLFYGLV